MPATPRQQTSSRSLYVVLSLLLLTTAMPRLAIAATLLVPSDYPTIQAAIEAAADGDTVLVSPGTYVERLNILGKSITVESLGGPLVTTIDASLSGTAVLIDAGPDQRPVLRGFTITRGYEFPFAGGVVSYGGPALIEHNVVTGNFGCTGSGIEAYFSAATIRNNVVFDNRSNCSGGSGSGISVAGAGTAQVLDNVITGNISDGGGGGVSLLAAGEPTISGNLIQDNVSYTEGGGLYLGNTSKAIITNNIIARNSAGQGGGISWLVPLDEEGPIRVVNNTIAYNTAIRGSGIFADGYDDSTQVTNNILVGSGEQWILECGTFEDLNPPIIAFNDVFNVDGYSGYGGSCTDQTGVNGNIATDPLFVDAPAGDFHLQASSPGVDRGRNTGAPRIDIDGEPRPMDGDGDGSAVVDFGADELLGETGEFLTELSPGRFWIGLKNSDDQGTRFDLLTEVYQGELLVASGLVRCINGVTRNPNYAREVAVPFAAFEAVAVNPGDVMTLKVFARIGTNPDDTKCPGHNNAQGLRLYYDGTNRQSRFGAAFSPDSLTEFFLHSAGGVDFLDDMPPIGTSALFKDSGAVKFGSGNVWKAVGAWSMTLP